MKVALGIMGGFIVLLMLIAGFVWSSYSTAGKKQNGIIAIYEDMQNVYANSIIETLEQKGMILSKHKDDVLEVIDKNMIRYQNDQNLLFKAVSEAAGITVSPELYLDMSRSVESGYRAFESTQRSKIDRVRNFKDFLDYSIQGKVAQLVGTFPSEKAKFIMDQLIINKGTKNTFKTGEMERPKLFKDQ